VPADGGGRTVLLAGGGAGCAPGAGGGDSATTRTAAASLALLAVAAYCQIAAAGLAAALAAARRFAVSAGLYVAASTVTLLSATGLMLLLGILGAPLGILTGSLLLLATHRGYLSRFGFRSRPVLRALAQRETWRLTALSSGSAAIPLVQQLQLTVALIAVSGAVGAVTAYTYAYFLAALLVSVTLNTIAFVMLPAVVAALEERGPAAAREAMDFAVPTALFLYVPVAVAYACFGRPVLDAVLGGSLNAENLALLWDASRIFLAAASPKRSWRPPVRCCWPCAATARLPSPRCPCCRSMPWWSSSSGLLFLSLSPIRPSSPSWWSPS